MSNMLVSDAHKYWLDPDADKLVSESYKSVCRPEFFPPLKAVSDMWVGIFGRFGVPQDATILELGCNCGRNLYYLQQAGWWNVMGVEINPKARQFGERHFGEDLADRILVSSIEGYMAEAGRHFDVVFTSGVLMHIHPASEWIFQRMSEVARTWLMCSEVELKADTARNIYEWPRNYRAIFEGFGFEQLHEQVASAQSGRTILRVFKRKADE